MQKIRGEDHASVTTAPLPAGVSLAIRCSFPLESAARLAHIIRALAHLCLDGKSAHLLLQWMLNTVLVLLWMTTSVVVTFLGLGVLEYALAATDIYRQSTIQHALDMILTYKDL